MNTTPLLSEYDKDTHDLNPVEKDVYNDYGDAGVIGASVPQYSGEKYYTLQGFEISNPTAPGIYFHKHNGRTSKILIP